MSARLVLGWCTGPRYGSMASSCLGMGCGASCRRALSTTHTATSPATGLPELRSLTAEYNCGSACAGRRTQEAATPTVKVS